MVFGGVDVEHLQLNEETLWTGGPYDPVVKGASQALPEIRRLLFAGEIAKAHDLFGRRMMGVPYEQMKYQSLGDLLLTFPSRRMVTDYRRALDLDAAVVWIMDDDTIPQPGALAALVRARERYAVEPGGPLGPPAVVASRVEWVDGREHPMNTPRTKPGVGTAERAAALAVGCAPIRTASFVSILVDVARVREAGLPVAAFFLWNDDFEYSARLLRGRRGLACPASVVRHHTKAFGGTDVDPGPRFYFEVRNKLWTFTRSPALGPVERVLYAGSTARRWARTIARSEDRATLLRGLGRGVRDGLAAPRRTDEVLAEAVPGRLPPVLDGLPGPGGR